MTTQASTPTILNPFAPEYNPMPTGITLPPPPFFLQSAPSTAFPPPSSSSQHFLSPQIFTYLPPTYYVTPPNPIAIPQTEAVNHSRRPERGRARRRGGFEESRERERENFVSRVEKNPNINEKGSVGFSKNDKFSAWEMRRDENRHRVMPLRLDLETTTVMIKNIPYDCPRKELMKLLDDFCLLENGKAKSEGTSQAAAEELFTYAYDFLYLPIDFRTKRSRGFAFVNFTNPITVRRFSDAFHLKKWDFADRKNWPKKIEIVCAKIQGKEALVDHFSESNFQCETDEFLPVSFSPPRDGSRRHGKLTVIGNRRPISHWEGHS